MTAVTTTERERVRGQITAAVTAGRSVVLRGSMGIGKTHLLGETIAALRRDGWTCTQVSANAAASTIPFGTLTEFIPDGEVSDRSTLLRVITDSLRAIGHGARHLIAIDDAPLLDDQSVAVFHQLLSSSAVQIIATARSSDAQSAALNQLWHDVDADQIEVRPLGDQSAASLVEAQMGLDAQATTVHRIVQRAEGNPLFLIELARAANDGTPEGLTQRLRDVVRGRIDRIDEVAQAQLRLIAVADPFDTDLAIADAQVIGHLERVGLVTTVEEQERVVARPAHPLYGEVVRDGLSALQRKEVSRRLAVALSEHPVAHRGNALRLAGWLMACGDQPSVELAIPAAREAIALLNVELANEMVNIATAVDPGFEALFVAGEVARVTGDYDRALDWLGRAFAIAEESSDLRAVALAMAQIHGFYRNRPEEAVHVLAAAAARMTDETQRVELEMERVLFGSMLGRYADVLDAAERILEHPDCDVEARWTACTNVAWAEVQLIDLRKVHDHLDAAFMLMDRSAIDRPSEIDLVRAVNVNVLIEEGRLGDALTGDQFTEQDEAPNGLTRFAASQAAWMTGDIATARRLVDGAVEQLSTFDAFNAYPFVQAGSALLGFVTGDADRASADIDASIARGGGKGMWDQIWLARARAWSAILDDRPDEAVNTLVEGVRAGIETSHYGWSVIALHDAIGWGAASVVAEQFRPLRVLMHGAVLMECLADSAIALATGDLASTRQHIGTLLGFGSWWHAGVVSAGLALAYPQRDDVAARRAATAASLWTPPSTPQVPAIRDLALSQRRIDVVREALRGRADREIAESLFLSVRTVSNHLGGAYASLELAGRSELFDLFAPHGMVPPAAS